MRLRLLTISGGDEDGSGRGGGIYFRGNGVLEVRDSIITANLAGNGGGIYAEGTGSDAELIVGSNVLISNNTARFNGGGIVADQLEMSMLEPGSILLGNDALGVGGSGGYGGGLYVRTADRASVARLGSGLASTGVVRGNTATYGGGIAVGGDPTGDGFASLLVYATQPGQPARVIDNFASAAGGGIHVRAEDSALGGSVFPQALFFNATLEDNVAPKGAAAQVQGSDTVVLVEEFSQFIFNLGPWPPGAVGCDPGVPCGRIARNISRDINSLPTAGATLNAEFDARIQIGSLSGGVAIEDNRGGYLIRSENDDDFTPTELRNGLIRGNTLSQGLIRVRGGSNLFVLDSTIAGNVLENPASPLVSAQGMDVALRRSILWQPGNATLSRSGGTVALDNLIASEVASLVGGGLDVILVEPRFIDPARGDFRLRAASPAVDFATPIAGDDRDLIGLPRDQDLPVKIDNGGVRDIGAFERQDLLPLVLNADFDFSDLRLWTRFTGAWDGSQNVVGSSGSGSWSYSATGLNVPRVELGRQCIHLPGPATYRLNGRGKGGGGTIATRDFAVLAWEYRRTGSEACNAGTPDASGELTVGAGTNWGTAGTATLIDVPPGDWTSSSSITITLVAVDGGVTSPRSISAFFDGIVLEVAGGDALFGDGFECPPASPGARDPDTHDVQDGAGTGHQRPLGESC